jgi:SAM-dependent methyltransferase
MNSCRFCGETLGKPFIDLGKTPLANSYLKKADLTREEPSFPLRLFLCEQCSLVQSLDVNTSEHIFTDYAYFSSYSESWLRHAKAYTDMMVQRFDFNPTHRVVELASNDGYLLQYFKEKGIPVLGVEPASNVAEAAQSKGITTLVRFFGEKTAQDMLANGQTADLLIGNNVLAHVPDLNDFVKGMKCILAPEGIITMEFPHLLRLIKENQFDTIYHEHFSYFLLHTVERVFAAHGLVLFDVEEIPTHGGSLRIYGRHAENQKLPIRDNIIELRKREITEGFLTVHTYQHFSEQVLQTKAKLLRFLQDARAKQQKVVGYGAPAKGNTLLNFCGITTDLIDYTVDISPHKQHHFLPGSHIPIYAPDMIRATKPDFVLILAWNLKDEITRQMSYVYEWGGKFVVPIPEVTVLDDMPPATSRP